MSTASAPRRAASSAASLTMFARSAPTKPGGLRGHGVEIRARIERHLPRVHREDLLPFGEVGPIDVHPAVEPPRPEQRGIEDLGAVRRGDHDHGRARVEPVHLGEELVECLLALVVAADDPLRPRALPTASSSSMNTMQGAFSRACEKRSRTRAAPDADEHLHELRSAELKNGTPASPATARASNVLPVPGGPTSSTPLGHPPAELLVALGRFEEVDDLAELRLRLVVAGDIAERRNSALLLVEPRLVLAEGGRGARDGPCRRRTA